jgi:NAD(P)-dependent dehydrogenase (short-subunit alcohol dehydrogenase family)
MPGRVAGKVAFITGAARAGPQSRGALFLASDEDRYITGVPLPVDAGFMVK